MQKIQEAEESNNPLARDAAKVGVHHLGAGSGKMLGGQTAVFLAYAASPFQASPGRTHRDRLLHRLGTIGARLRLGQEALRLASAQDDEYAVRLGVGANREDIENEADQFFSMLVPPSCPDWLKHEDYAQLVMLRDQWI